MMSGIGRCIDVIIDGYKWQIVCKRAVSVAVRQYVSVTQVLSLLQVPISLQGKQFPTVVPAVRTKSRAVRLHCGYCVDQRVQAHALFSSFLAPPKTIGLWGKVLGRWARAPKLCRWVALRELPLLEQLLQTATDLMRRCIIDCATCGLHYRL